MKLLGGISPVIAVDRCDRTPLHCQIYDAYRAGILNSSLSPGQRVPSTRALSSELGVSRISYGPIPYIRAIGVLQQHAKEALS